MRPSPRLALALAVLCAACGSSTGPSFLARTELARQHAKWSAAGLSDYAFDYDISANLAPQVTQPVRITVQSGAVTAVVNRTTGAAVSLTAYSWPTIETLFARAEQALSADGFRTTIEYDRALGYPTRIDAWSEMPDAGWSARMANLAPIQ